MSEERSVAGTVVAWVLYAGQLAFELVLLLFLGFSVMAGDSCGTAAPGMPEPRICSGTYFASLFYGYALVLAAAVVVTPVLILRARRRRWLRPVLVVVSLVVLFVIYMTLLTL